jgi:hypothetical protein
LKDSSYHEPFPLAFYPGRTPVSCHLNLLITDGTFAFSGALS